MLNSTDINASLKDCADLGSALSVLNSVGIETGTVRIAADGLRGWIVFKNKKVVQAVVAETAQVGQQALATLAKLQDARCTFLALAAAPAQVEPGQVAERTVRTPPPQTTKPAQQVMSEDDFRAGVFGRDVNSEFLNVDPRLQDLDAPVRRNMHFARIDREDEAQDPGAILLAKVGFTSDFVDVSPTPPGDPWADFHGDPQNLASAEYLAPERIALPVRIFVVIGLFTLCFSIYLIPELIWRSADADTRADLERRQRESIANVLKDEQIVPVQHPFALPAGSVAAGGAVPVTPSTTVDDFGNVPPDLSPDTPENLNRLIRWYLRHGNFKKAKELASKALALSLMPADRRMFSYLYNQCSGDNALHMDMSTSTPFGLRKVRELTAAEEDQSRSMMAKNFTIDMHTQPQSKAKLAKDAANAGAAKNAIQPAQITTGSQTAPGNAANQPAPPKAGGK